MNSSPQVIVVPINEQPKDDKDTKVVEPAQSSYWDLIKTICIIYIIVGIICYFFNKEWFDYLYQTPFNKLKEMLQSKKD